MNDKNIDSQSEYSRLLRAGAFEAADDCSARFE